jgi:hypothetical protein
MVGRLRFCPEVMQRKAYSPKPMFRATFFFNHRTSSLTAGVDIIHLFHSFYVKLDCNRPLEDSHFTLT